MRFDFVVVVVHRPPSAIFRILAIIERTRFDRETFWREQDEETQERIASSDVGIIHKHSHSPFISDSDDNISITRASHNKKCTATSMATAAAAATDDEEEALPIFIDMFQER